MSLIVPVLNERAIITDLFATLEPFYGLHEIIIVDGGSTDGTIDVLAQHGVVTVLDSAPGRAKQMNAGARAAAGHILLFLHADTTIEPEGPERALQAIDRGADGGCFAVRIRSNHRRLRLAGRLQTLRSKVMCSATGDQAIFARRNAFETLGGFAESLTICEDLDFVRRFARVFGAKKFAPLDEEVVTSARRWEKQGVSKTIALMWALRTAYHLGACPDRLSRYYRSVR